MVNMTKLDDAKITYVDTDFTVGIVTSTPVRDDMKNKVIICSNGEYYLLDCTSTEMMTYLTYTRQVTGRVVVIYRPKYKYISCISVTPIKVIEGFTIFGGRV